jgi:hypothetical protein
MKRTFSIVAAAVAGLLRVASPCREGEYPLSIGGGGDVRVSQNGRFTVP